jgi:hypothetical protein
MAGGQQAGSAGPATGVPGQSSLSDVLARLPHQQTPETLGQLLLFGRQGLGGMLPENIQQHGLIGSLFGGLKGWPTQTPGLGQSQPTLSPAPNANVANLQPAPQLPPPQQPQPTSPGSPGQAPPFQPRFQVPPGSDTAGRGQQVIPGQTNPHLPGFDPSAVPFLGKQAMNDQESGMGGLGLLAQLFGGGGGGIAA